MSLFSRQAITKIPVVYNLLTLWILYTEFGWVWTTPWPDEKELFLKFLIWRNYQISVSKPLNFFSRKAIAKIIFVLHSNYTGHWSLLSQMSRLARLNFRKQHLPSPYYVDKNTTITMETLSAHFVSDVPCKKEPICFSQKSE